jgi:hypothetical protein
MAGLHGGNTITGRTDEQHAKAISCGVRPSLGEDALNILFGHWDALPRTWKPSGSRKGVKRYQSHTATQACEQRMLEHVLSCLYDEKVSSVAVQTKERKAARYNTHFEYKAGDPGFLT